MPQAPGFRSSVGPEKATLINTVMTDQINNHHWATKSAGEVLKQSTYAHLYSDKYHNNFELFPIQLLSQEINLTCSPLYKETEGSDSGL